VTSLLSADASFAAWRIHELGVECAHDKETSTSRRLHPESTGSTRRPADGPPSRLAICSRQP
jgi:hypothetical protein